MARLRAFADDGASRAYLRVLDLDDLEHLDLLAAEVAAPPAVLTTSPDRSTCDQLRPLRIAVMVSVAEHVEST